MTHDDLIGRVVRLVEHAAAEPRTLETVIQNLRRSTGAQEVDAMHLALADLLAGVGSVLGKEQTS